MKFHAKLKDFLKEKLSFWLYLWCGMPQSCQFLWLTGQACALSSPEAPCETRQATLSLSLPGLLTKTREERILLETPAVSKPSHQVWDQCGELVASKVRSWGLGRGLGEPTCLTSWAGDSNSNVLGSFFKFSSARQLRLRPKPMHTQCPSWGASILSLIFNSTNIYLPLVILSQALGII